MPCMDVQTHLMFTAAFGSFEMCAGTALTPRHCRQCALIAACAVAEVTITFAIELLVLTCLLQCTHGGTVFELAVGAPSSPRFVLRPLHVHHCIRAVMMVVSFVPGKA
jgi:hypothetical protein